ncbi:alginate lyase family protein [Blastococcus sp. URHD0036]|uniref:heparinase II/III family protein n=1 Tax=Blastococcus sp. URHD0036 TaxID=1380356 RepID=UPI00068A2E65|nr:alginate lyase family protein [Blastococcus sp. URHD0036]
MSRLLVPPIDWERALTDFRGGVDRPVLLDRSRAREIADRCPEQVAALIQAAERICSGVVSYFGYPDAELGSPIDWNHDPLRDVGWPLVEAARIDHRRAAADPKWIWELNRLQHLPLLAEAWLFTGDDRYAETALAHLDSWLDQNPVDRGIAWRGAFEAGIRAISVAVALQGLRDHEGLTPARFERVVRMLVASAERCWWHRSRFSSANNHLVGELAGLATVAMLFPELAPASRWERQAISGLVAEASRQIFPDGSGAEQAVGYQVFTADLLLLVSGLLASRGEDPPAALLAAVDRSAEYLTAVVGDADPAPRYGDDDEGFALRLGPEPRPTVRDHLGVVAALTGNPRARRAGTDTLTARWVGTIASGSMRGAPAPAVSGESSFVAPHGGLVVLRSAGRRITVDVAPLGYLAIAAHGHADALSVTLSLDGREVIGHPGAASYYGHPEWRAVHRSTRAHPTVTVDGVSQSVSGGPFLWTRHARVRIRSVDLERGVVDAEHDGYRRLSAPVTHRRWLIAPPGDPAILVVDQISGAGGHEIRTAWPVHPEFDVAATPEGHLVTRDGARVLQILTAAAGGLDLEQVKGDEASHLGWWSDRLESRVPAWVVGGTTSGSTPLVMATVFGPPVGEVGAVTDLDVVQGGDLITVAWRVGGRPRERVIDRAVPVAPGRRPWLRRGTGAW